jgi:hypothetical protein
MRLLPLKAILIVLSISSISFADFISGTFYNPGIKIGYQFGPRGGFIVGFENSLTAAATFSFLFLGAVGGIEYNINKGKFIEYWEFESGFGLGGIALGGEWNYGYHGSFRIFTGAIGYISYKRIFDARINELALIGKYPCPIVTVEDHGSYIFGKRTSD